MSYPTEKEYKQSVLRRMGFKVRNFVSGRMHRTGFNASLWFRVQARRRKAAAMDPVWRESWWCLEKRYTGLAKKYCRLELRYMKIRDELRKLRKHEQAGANRSRD